MTVCDLTKGLELTEDVIKVFEDIKCNDPRVATSRRGSMRMLAMRRF